MQNDKSLSFERPGAGALVFNSPEKRNAFSPEMSLAAADVTEDFGADPAVRVIVLSGAGARAFVSGGDTSRFEGSRATAQQVAEYVARYAAGIADNAHSSIVAAKRVIDELVEDKDERDTASCAKVVAACFASQDYVAGRRAFMEKRRPVFTGR